MSYKPELIDGSIYTLRRRIPTRPTDERDAPLEQSASVPKPGRRGNSVAPATGRNSLISRLFPTVRLGR